MKLLILLAVFLSFCCGLAVFLFASLGSPLLAVAAAVLSVLLWSAADHHGRRLREREEDRQYYGHPRL